MFPLNGIILLRGVRKSSLVDNGTINVEGTKQGLDKLGSII